MSGGKNCYLELYSLCSFPVVSNSQVQWVEIMMCEESAETYYAEHYNDDAEMFVTAETR